MTAEKGNNQKLHFAEFLDKFEQVDPPVTVLSDIHQECEERNGFLPEHLIHTFLPQLAGKSDALEVIPCFKFLINEQVFAIVVWVADVLDYHYYMYTMDMQLNIIAECSIASTKMVDNEIYHTIAQIDEELLVHSITSSSSEPDALLSPSTDSIVVIRDIDDDGSITVVQ